MVKEDFYRIFGERVGLPVRQAKTICDEVFDTLSNVIEEECLGKQERVYISGLGTFKGKKFAPKKVGNIKDGGDAIELPETIRVRFDFLPASYKEDDSEYDEPKDEGDEQEGKVDEQAAQPQADDSTDGEPAKEPEDTSSSSTTVIFNALSGVSGEDAVQLLATLLSRDAAFRRRIMERTKKCAFCNGEFYPSTANQKYCSKQCGYKAGKARTRIYYRLGKQAAPIFPNIPIGKQATSTFPNIPKKVSIHEKFTSEIVKGY